MDQETRESISSLNCRCDFFDEWLVKKSVEVTEDVVEGVGLNDVVVQLKRIADILEKKVSYKLKLEDKKDD